MRTVNYIDPKDFVSNVVKRKFNCEPIEVREIRKDKLYEFVLPDLSKFHIKLARFLRENASPEDWWNSGRFNNDLAYSLAASAAIPESVCRIVDYDWSERYFITESVQAACGELRECIDAAELIQALKKFALSVYIKNEDLLRSSLSSSRAKSWLSKEDFSAELVKSKDRWLIADNNQLRSEISSIFDVLDEKQLGITMHGDVCPDNVLVKNGRYILCDFEQSGNRLFHLDIASIGLSFVNCRFKPDTSGYPVCKIEDEACKKFAPHLSMRDHNELLCCAYLYWIFVWAPGHYSLPEFSRSLFDVDHVMNRIRSSQRFVGVAAWLNDHLRA